MSRRETYEQKATALILPIIEQMKFELVDVEYVKEGGTWYLRAYIDKPGGITVDDYTLSYQYIRQTRVSDLLDEEDFIEDSYVMEVSSPGLDRPLKKDRDLERSIGREVDVKLFRPLAGQKEMTGTLLAFTKDTLTIGFGEEDRIDIPRETIALVRLSFDF